MKEMRVRGDRFPDVEAPPAVKGLLPIVIFSLRSKKRVTFEDWYCLTE